MAKFWTKFHHKLLDDPTMGRLPDNLWRRISELRLLAGELDEDGRLPPISDISWRLRIDEQTLSQEFDTLARVYLLEYITDNPLNSYWFIPGFKLSQAASSDAERMRQYRKRKRKEPKEKEREEEERDLYIYIDRSNNERNTVVTKRNGHVTHGMNTENNVQELLQELHQNPNMMAIIQELTKISKTPLSLEVGLGVESYYDATICLIGWDATPTKILGFLTWWQDPTSKKKYNKSIYEGDPALKSVLTNWRNYMLDSKKKKATITTTGGTY